MKLLDDGRAQCGGGGAHLGPGLTWRVGRQLLGTPATDPVEVTSALGGVQAQVASASPGVAIRTRRLPDLENLLWEERA